MKKINFDAFDRLYKLFSTKDMPLLQQQKAYYQEKKPFSHLTIIQNTPITKTTLFKIETLLYGGANLIVTTTKGLGHDLEAIDILKSAGVEYTNSREIKRKVDVCLDCSAEFSHITPTYGTVELTQTGSHIYKKINPDFPVISVDESRTKNLETLFGTGDGFLRALKSQVKENLDNKHFIIFGFGKVGKGVAYALRQFTNSITVVDKIEYVKKHPFQDINLLHLDNKEEIEESIKNAFCIVTATGVKNLISSLFFDKSLFSGKYLANMGAEDEFGEMFLDEEILCKRLAINFSLENPTELKFLDPIFYAHNIAAECLLAGNIKTGFNAFPKDLDQKIITQWNNFHNMDTSDLI